MRYFEISSGFRVPVSEEEQGLIDLVSENPVNASDLDLRAGHIAEQMVKKGLFVKVDRDGEIYFDADRMDLWRY